MSITVLFIPGIALNANGRTVNDEWKITIDLCERSNNAIIFTYKRTQARAYTKF